MPSAVELVGGTLEDLAIHVEVSHSFFYISIFFMVYLFQQKIKGTD